MTTKTAKPIPSHVRIALNKVLAYTMPDEAADFENTPATKSRGHIYKALVTVRQNHYSVPVALAGLRVQARIGAREIVISRGRQVVARHPRLHGRYQTAARLDHYLELLRIKPAAFKGSLALRQERELGRWPACFDQLW